MRSQKSSRTTKVNDCGLHLRTWSARAAIQEGENNFHLCMPTVHNTKSITQMMQMNWNVMIFSRNRKQVSFSEMT